MPKNKDALIRYRVINRLLMNRVRRVTIDDLIHACEEALDRSPIGKRTIEKDIHEMRHNRGLGYYAPIVCKSGYYLYAEDDYSIDRLPISNEEMDALIMASSLLEQFKGVEILNSIPGTVQKIRNHLKIRRAFNREEQSDFIDIEKATEVHGTEYLDDFIKAIKQKHVVNIQYRAFNKNRSYTHIFHPYLLKEYRNRWYIFGYNSYWKGLRLYALDRIEQIERNYSVKYRVCEKSPKHYFRNLVGVTRFKGTEPEHIILKFSKQQAPYILTQPIHESQKVIEHTEDHLIISLNVHSSPELEILILGWSKEVEVLEPEDFREQIKEMIQGAMENYE